MLIYHGALSMTRTIRDCHAAVFYCMGHAIGSESFGTFGPFGVWNIQEPAGSVMAR